MLVDEQNRSMAFGQVGKFRGIGAERVFSALTSGLIKLTCFQMLASPVGGIDLHRDQFAWDAEAISFSDEDFSYEDPVLAQFSSI